MSDEHTVSYTRSEELASQFLICLFIYRFYGAIILAMVHIASLALWPTVITVMALALFNLSIVTVYFWARYQMTIYQYRYHRTHSFPL